MILTMRSNDLEMCAKKSKDLYFKSKGYFTTSCGYVEVVGTEGTCFHMLFCDLFGLR